MQCSDDYPFMLVNIQALRFIAALLVVLYHASAHLGVAGQAAGPLFAFGRAAGFAGVDIFFVISGFIMVWTTPESSGPADAWSFMRRRVARIYSGYWPFYAIAIALFTWLGGTYLTGVSWLGSLFLWPTPLPDLLIPVSWTLIFEMVFYVLFAVLIAIAGRRRAWWLTGLLAAMLGWAAYTQFVRHAYDPGRLELMSIYEQYLAFPYLLEFLAGALLAIRCLRRPGASSAWGWGLLLAGAALFAAGGWLNESGIAGRLIQGYFVNVRVAVFGSASLLIVAGLVRLEQAGVRFPPRLGIPAGGSSYALYLSHTLVLAATNHLGFDRWAGGLSPVVAQGAYVGLIGLIVGYSLLHHQVLERPLHRSFRRLLRVRAPASTPRDRRWVAG
ncbi:acyltransferase family protein [Elongatibacter sediminis]|uniref:Acyltransferase n=1 Tax=Elongatibacter sediminis TaxID=3119006 RepID=A0AAW9RA42_9GAMM